MDSSITLQSDSHSESARIAALKSYALLDTDKENIYDQLTWLASQICGTKFSLITLVDQERVWFKSRIGIDATETRRTKAFCDHVIAGGQPLVINDAGNDPRFADNPLVIGLPRVSFYAGIPLIDDKGFSLGTLSVLDPIPRQLTDSQLQSLKIIAAQVIAQFRMGRELAQKRNYEDQLASLTGQVPGFISDVTDEKNVEVQTYENSKLAALGEMASGVAHEINNPLSIIIGKTSLMKVQLSAPTWNREKITEDLGKIEDTALRISKIIKGLTAFSRNAEHDSFTVVEVRQIIEDTVSLVNEKFKYHSIDIIVNCPLNITLECNATQIGQVLMNLLTNSFDAVKPLEKKWIKIEVKRFGSHVNIRVSDSGQGISPRIRDKIMHSFFTTKSVGEGMGLGLSLSKGLVESHNGNLKYIPSATYTTFEIQLPLRANSTQKNVA